MLLFVKHLINSVVSFSWSLCRKSAALLARRTKSSSFSEKSNISNGSLTLGGRRTPSSRSSNSFAWSWKRYTFIWMFSRPLMLNSISSAHTGGLELNLVARDVEIILFLIIDNFRFKSWNVRSIRPHWPISFTPTDRFDEPERYSWSCRWTSTTKQDSG